MKSHQKYVLFLTVTVEASKLLALARRTFILGPGSPWLSMHHTRAHLIISRCGLPAAYPSLNEVGPSRLYHARETPSPEQPFIRDEFALKSCASLIDFYILSTAQTITLDHGKKYIWICIRRSSVYCSPIQFFHILKLPFFRAT